MHKKSEVETIFQNFYNMIENQFQTKVSILRFDNGTEYYNSILGRFFEKKGSYISLLALILLNKMKLLRKNKLLLEVSRAMMFYMNLPKYLWRDAVLTASYLINRIEN